MEKIYAFLDECGAYSPSTSNLDQEHLFIVTAVIIKQSDIGVVEESLKKISMEDFSGQEIKSSNIKGNHQRRLRILNKVLSLPFKVLCLVVDKRELLADSGVKRNKKYFYEFLNQLIYTELRSSYPILSIVTDRVGGSQFAEEFTRYVKTHRRQITLFDQEDFNVVDSKEVRPVQLADLMAGTLSYIYEETKKERVEDGIDYYSMIVGKLQKVKFFPKSYDDSLFQHTDGDPNFNIEIAQIALRKAEQFIQDNSNKTDEIIRRQKFTLDYLLFRFKYNPHRRYISTRELLNAIESASLGHLSEHSFRRNVIGSLRDKGVIISSSKKGYKLPSTEKEINDYYQNVSGVVLPMIHRVNLCNNTLRLASSESKDYLLDNEFRGLRAVVDAINKIDHQPS